MDISTAASFLAGIGFGSAVSVSLQYFLNRKAHRQDQMDKELRETYYGLLESLQKLASVGSKENTMILAYWLARIKIVGSKEVCQIVEVWRNTLPGTDERDISQEKMIRAMRKHLRIKE